MRARVGHTLLEVIIAMTIAAVILAALYEILYRARMSVDNSSSISQAQLDANELVSRIEDELRQAGSTSPDWSLSEAGDAITFNRCLGAEDGVVSWDVPWTITVQPGETDVSDGIDNNGNGLVDEMSLVVLDPSTSGVRETWAANVAPAGLVFLLNGKNLAINLTLEVAGAKPGAAPISVSASGAVSLRN